MTNLLIETKRLILRPFSNSDVSDAVCYSNQPSVAYWMSDMILPDEQVAAGWIGWLSRSLNLQDPFVVLAVILKDSGRCIGIVGVHPKEDLDGEVELLYGISDLYQNNGYAGEASEALIRWVFDNTQITSLTAIVKPENLPSARVIKKLGFDYTQTKVLPYDGKPCTFKCYMKNK